MNEEQLLAFEKQILTTQIQLEESMKKIASAMNKPTVILLDRVRAHSPSTRTTHVLGPYPVCIAIGLQAALDISAYLPYSFWKKLLQDLDITEKQLRERYTAVVHLVPRVPCAVPCAVCFLAPHGLTPPCFGQVTAANGAESYYTTANNAARTEGIEQARELDDKVSHLLRHTHHARPVLRLVVWGLCAGEARVDRAHAHLRGGQQH